MKPAAILQIPVRCFWLFFPMRQGIYKVPDGKLLKVFVETENDILTDLKITGDFFLHPEEKITVLEDALRGERLDADGLKQKLTAAIEKEEIELFGVDPASIVQAILLAK